MTFEHTAIFEHPVDEVFAWHARSGALSRLLPPWQPVTIRQESRSLRDGEAIVGLPGPITWRARHLPSGFVPGHQFTDVLATPVLDHVIGWRHLHRFDEEPGGRTRITDRVDTRVPAGFLREMFAYRTRQVAGDLAAHGRWPGPRQEPGPGSRPLTIALTGSSGTIGSALCAYLSTGGHRVVRLVRGEPSRPDQRRWRPERPEPGLFVGVDALVHLAGASIAGRFTAAHKDEIWASRIGPTRRLVEAAARAEVPVVVSASAIGIYGADRGDEELTETSTPGQGFLARLVEAWEADTEPARLLGTRVVNVRTGIVLTPNGGALRLLRHLFNSGLGGTLGGGRPWMAWIAVDDLLDIYLRALVDTDLAGPVNATGPNPVRNAELTRTLARVLRRPALVPVPRLGPSLLLGREGAEEVALASQRVTPARLVAAGHPFRYRELEPALRHVLGRTGA